MTSDKRVKTPSPNQATPERSRRASAPAQRVAQARPQTPTQMRAAIAEMVRQTQDDNRDVVATMPSQATSARQQALEKKHGTPKAFAQACINAIGAISPLEAHLAIKKYRDEWEAAS